MKVKRGIGIDIGSSHVCAVQIARIGKVFCIEKAFAAQIRRSEDSLLGILKSLTSKYGFNRRAAIAISVPKEAAFYRSLETDAISLEQISAAGLSISEYDFPIEPGEMMARPYFSRQIKGNGEKHSVLTTAVAKESLRNTLEILHGAKIQPDLIDTHVFAIHSTVSKNHPEIRTGTAIITHVTESHLTLAVTQNNTILMVRHFPIIDTSGNDTNSSPQRVAKLLSIEADILWQKLFGNEIDHDSRIYLVTAESNTTGIKAAIEEHLQCKTVVVNPYAKVLLKYIHHIPTDIFVAEGLALRILAPDRMMGVNFLEAENLDVRPALNVKKEFAICAVLVATVVIVSLIGLFMQLARLERQYAGIKNEMKEIFQRTLPEEKNIVNPVAQLEQRLQALQKDYALFGSLAGAGAGPLEVLHAVALSTPSELKISLDDVQVTTESVRLAGTSESFESVYNWQHLLSEALHFSTVDIRDIRREVDSEMVRFVVLASFAAEKST